MNQYLTNLYQNLNLPNAFDRREILLTQMTSLDDQEINCSKCSAPCCTFVANSMQTTPLETLELYDFLVENQLLSTELLDEFSSTVAHYRLDHNISTKKNQTLRRTYTCPLFMASPKGCPISPEYKPYGCLGFNPTSTNISEGENCSSNITLLEKRDDLFGKIEETANRQIQTQFSWYWEKLPLPVALLECTKLNLKSSD